MSWYLTRYLISGLCGALLGWLIIEPWGENFSAFYDWAIMFFVAVGITMALILEKFLFNFKPVWAGKTIFKWRIYAVLAVGTALIKIGFTPPEVSQTIVEPDTQVEARFLVLDVSRSMRGWPGFQGAIDHLKKATGEYLDVLTRAQSQDLVGCVVFSIGSRRVGELNQDYRGLQQKILQLRASGGTDMVAGLQAAKDGLMQAPSHLPREMILVSDGVPNNREGVLNLLPQLAGIPVHTIGAGSGYDRALLMDIAARTGGQFFPADDVSQLSRVFTIIASGNLVGGNVSKQEGQETQSVGFLTRASAWSLLGLLMGLVISFIKRGYGMFPRGTGVVEAFLLGSVGGTVGGFFAATTFVGLYQLIELEGSMARGAGFAVLGLCLGLSIFLTEELFTMLKAD